MRLFKGSSSAGRSTVKAVRVRGTGFKSVKGVKISPLKFKVPKVKVAKVKI